MTERKISTIVEREETETIQICDQCATTGTGDKMHTFRDTQGNELHFHLDCVPSIGELELDEITVDDVIQDAVEDSHTINTKLVVGDFDLLAFSIGFMFLFAGIYIHETNMAAAVGSFLMSLVLIVFGLARSRLTASLTKREFLAQ